MIETDIYKKNVILPRCNSLLNPVDKDNLIMKNTINFKCIVVHIEGFLQMLYTYHQFRTQVLEIFIPL
jgi:hypothetical protein